jgi:hypothetical protein
VTEPGGVAHVLAFSEGPDAGPHPVTADDLHKAFTPASGWQVTAITPDRVRTRYHDEHGAPALLATVTRS